MTFAIDDSCLAVFGLHTKDRYTLSVVMPLRYAELCKLTSAQEGLAMPFAKRLRQTWPVVNWRDS